MTTLLPLSGCTYGWLYQAPLHEALRSLSEHGFRTFELTTAAPHLFTSTLGSFEKFELVRTLRAFDLQPISLNPGFLDINLISNNPEIRAVSERQMAAEIQLASELGASFVVLIPGRRHALAPAPAKACELILEDTLERLVAQAERLGVVLTLENSPYGFLGTGRELLALADRIDSPNLGLTYDVANAIAIESPSDGLREVAHRLSLVHVSDSWKNSWAHTSIGLGDVDFAAIAATLKAIDFRGPTVYELVDDELPSLRLDHDLKLLSKAGWSAEVLPQLTKQGRQ